MKNNDKDYQNLQNQKRIGLRLTAEERALMEIAMAEEGYSNVTAFIKHRVFGHHPEQKKRAIIQSHNSESIAVILKYKIMEMAEWFHYTYVVIRKSLETNVEESKKKFALDKLRTLSSYAKKITMQFTAICIDLNLPVSKLLREEIPNMGQRHNAFIMNLEKILFASGETTIYDSFDKYISIHGLVIQTTLKKDGNIYFILFCRGREKNEHTRFECRCPPRFCPEIGSHITVNGILWLAYEVDSNHNRQLCPRIIVMSIIKKPDIRNNDETNRIPSNDGL